MKTPVDIARIWMHESERVYGDKLIEDKDIEAYQKMMIDFAKKSFEVSSSSFGKRYTLGPRYWNGPALVNAGPFLLYQYGLKM